jgi:N-methylhydantoinase A
VGSADVWPQSREYERAMVAPMNAFIQPQMQSYPAEPRATLRDAGLRIAPLLTRSNGGVISVE